MKRNYLVGVAAFLLAMAISGPVKADNIHWKTNFKQALALSHQSGRLIMVDFYTDWCTYCKLLDKKTYVDARVIGLANKLIPVKLNPEKGKDAATAAKRYGVSVYPTILFIAPDGAVVSKIGGYAPADGFYAEMRNAVRSYADVPRLKAAIRRNPADSNSILHLLNLYATRQDTGNAKLMLEQLKRTDPKGVKGKLSAGYHALGVLYGQLGKAKQAYSYFVSARDTAKSPRDKAQSRIGLGICKLIQNDRLSARQNLTSAIATPGCPPELATRARQLLTFAEKSGGR